MYTYLKYFCLAFLCLSFSNKLLAKSYIYYGFNLQQINTQISKYQISTQNIYNSQQLTLGYNYLANNLGFNISFNYNLNNSNNVFNYTANNSNNTINIVTLQVKLYNPYNLNLDLQYNLFKANDLSINMLLWFSAGYAYVAQLNAIKTQQHNYSNSTNVVNNNNLVTQQEIDNNTTNNNVVNNYVSRSLQNAKSSSLSIDLYNPTPEQLQWYASNNYICVNVSATYYKCTLNNADSVVNPPKPDTNVIPQPDSNVKPKPDNNVNPQPNSNINNLGYNNTVKTSNKYINSSVGLGIDFNYNVFNNLAIYGKAVFVLVNKQFSLHNNKQLIKQHVLDGYKAHIGLKYSF